MKNAHTSPADIQKYLKDIDYPASKQDILDCAQNNEAPEDIMNQIEQLEEQEYNSPTDITEQMSKE